MRLVLVHGRVGERLMRRDLLAWGLIGVVLMALLVWLALYWSSRPPEFPPITVPREPGEEWYREGTGGSPTSGPA
jgi:hypothetical protein